MKVIMLFLTLVPFWSTAQSSKDISLYSVKEGKIDTTLFCWISADKHGYYFHFPDVISTQFVAKDFEKELVDTLIETRKIKFGPYLFKKQKNKIVFKDTLRNAYFDLYNIFGEEFTAPDLFSSSLDSYNIPTRLINENCVIDSKRRSIKTFQFFQTLDYHNIKQYRIIFIDKKTLLPCRMEYYESEQLQKMTRVIFIK